MALRHGEVGVRDGLRIDGIAVRALPDAAVVGHQGDVAEFGKAAEDVRLRRQRTVGQDEERRVFPLFDGAGDARKDIDALIAHGAPVKADGADHALVVRLFVEHGRVRGERIVEIVP